MDQENQTSRTFWSSNESSMLFLACGSLVATYTQTHTEVMEKVVGEQ